MRMDRFVAGLLTATLLGLAPLTTGVARAAGPAAAPALPEREITVKIVEGRFNRLFLTGRVTPDFAEKLVSVQKKSCRTKKCGWSTWKKVRTNQRGRFRVKVPAPRDGRWFWRAETPATEHYARTRSEVWYTYTT
jgi:hypothetical protein